MLLTVYIVPSTVWGAEEFKEEKGTLFCAFEEEFKG